MKPLRFIKSKGEIQYRSSLSRRIESELNLLPNGEYVLKINKSVKPRTVSQNRLFWMWMACISQETGASKEELHDYYCTLFNQRIVRINGYETFVTGGTSQLNTIQFTDFLNKVQADAASDFGIVLPLPSDLHWAEFEEQYKHFF